MKRARQKRKSQHQWQTLIDQYQSSGLSGSQFCQTHKIAYGSFCKWRQRLSPPMAVPVAENELASFIDVSALAGSTGRPWHITLKLGEGIELCLSQR